MAIYDISEIERKEEKVEEALPRAEAPGMTKDHLFSTLVTRFFFLLLLLADLIWAVYSLLFFALIASVSLLTLNKVQALAYLRARRWLSVKRSFICAIALGVALFSPSFGIMIACTYFLMYDKAGIEEVVPSSLQDQFKEFFKNSH